MDTLNKKFIKRILNNYIIFQEMLLKHFQLLIIDVTDARQQNLNTIKWQFNNINGYELSIDFKCLSNKFI